MAASELTLLIPASAILAVLFAAWLWRRVSEVKLRVLNRSGDSYLLGEEEQRGEDDVVTAAADIQDAISQGANSFLITEYRYLSVFMVRRLTNAPRWPLKYCN